MITNFFHLIVNFLRVFLRRSLSFARTKQVLIRAFIIIFVPIILTYWIFLGQKIIFQFQPLVKNQTTHIELQSFEIVGSYLNLDTDLLRYNAVLRNDVYSIIGGDVSDHIHELDLSIKTNTSSPRYQIIYKKPNQIFKNGTKDQIISAIQEIQYFPNINLKPEVLMENRVITANKTIGGSVTITAQLNFTSIIFLFLSILLLEGVVIQVFEAIYRFIAWK